MQGDYQPQSIADWGAGTHQTQSLGADCRGGRRVVIWGADSPETLATTLLPKWLLKPPMK